MIEIRAATAEDAEAILRIYNHYVANSVATFEEEPVELPAMVERMQKVAQARLPWLVAVEQGSVVGYAYAAPWQQRSAYRFAAESTVYIDPSATGRGLGSLLYAELLPAIRARGIRSVIGGIALPNDASVRLHEKLGFEKVSHFKEVGFKFERWVDVGHWQKG
jgi:phosphinothricin acetyltransferase